MKHHCIYVTLILLIACLSVPLSGCDISKGDGGVVDDTVAADYTDQLKELYEKAKEAGEMVPDDIYDWAKEDMQKMGDWEYKVVTLSTEGDGEIESELNVLGKERWQCFWVEATPDGTRFYFKKPVRSYLNHVGKAVKFIPMPSGGGGE